ncbi:MAG TPA: ABC transporter [Actinobacteria bacterium]|nr:ABC transporter [Actinomycetota bacterium]
MALWEGLLRFLFPREKVFLYPQANLSQLVGEHLVLVLVSSALAIIVGLSIGIFVTRPAGKDFLRIANELSSLAQTFPPVAVLALAVPLLGFGFKPTITALFTYSVLPILRNTIAGLEGVPLNTIEAASGMGMSRLQILGRIELPLALKVILAGIRISVIVNIGTATIGAVVGAGGLGSPIISGLVRDNPAFVLEGALAAALLALLADFLIGKAEQSLSWSH